MSRHIFTPFTAEAQYNTLGYVEIKEAARLPFQISKIAVSDLLAQDLVLST
jgi:hypothetical protein